MDDLGNVVVSVKVTNKLPLLVILGSILTACDVMIERRWAGRDLVRRSSEAAACDGSARGQLCGGTTAG